MAAPPCLRRAQPATVCKIREWKEKWDDMRIRGFYDKVPYTQFFFPFPFLLYCDYADSSAARQEESAELTVRLWFYAIA